MEKLIQEYKAERCISRNFEELNKKMIEYVASTDVDNVIKYYIIGFLEAHGKRELSENTLNLLGDIFD